MSTAQVPTSNGRAVAAPPLRTESQKKVSVGAILKDYTPTQITIYRATIAALTIALILALAFLYKALSVTAFLHAASSNPSTTTKVSDIEAPRGDSMNNPNGAFGWKYKNQN